MMQCNSSMTKVEAVVASCTITSGSSSSGPSHIWTVKNSGNFCMVVVLVIFCND